MFQKNNKEMHQIIDNNNDLILGQEYKQLPMDLNSSPLEDYFREILSKSRSSSNIKMTSAAKPVSIPGTLTTQIHDHSNYMAHTFPLMNGTQYQERNNRQKSKFTVGSLVEEKPPVPWPASLVTKPHDDTKYRHLKNVRNTNWPPQNHHPIDNDSDVFSMDEDVDDIQFNESDFDDDIDIDENEI